jgi:hypothetical protein
MDKLIVHPVLVKVDELKKPRNKYIKYQVINGVVEKVEWVVHN